MRLHADDFLSVFICGSLWSEYICDDTVALVTVVLSTVIALKWWQLA